MCTQRPCTIEAVSLVKKASISSENAGKPRLVVRQQCKGQCAVFESVRCAWKHSDLTRLSAPDQFLYMRARGTHA